MNFVAFDVETANSTRGSICAIGLVKFKDGLINDALYTLINPEEYFSEINTSIHGIKSEDVINEPTLPEFSDVIVKFIEDLPLVAHFAAFDIYALQDAFSKYNIHLPGNRYFCSYRLSKALYTKPSYRLNDMAKHFDIENKNHHNALNDAVVAGKLVKRILIDQAKELDILITDLNYDYGVLNSKGFLKRRDSSSKKFELSINEELHNKSHEFYGKNICFTGTLQSFTRKDIAQKITDIGATFQSGVTKNTNYLIVGSLETLEKASGISKSSKIIKAEKLVIDGHSIEILSEFDFIKLLN